MQDHGAKEFERIKQKRKISHDSRYTKPVARVAKRLKKVIPMPDADWEFVVFKDASPNAFALPGGKVGINTGLFTIADNDALLAAVLGHEISHATADHAYQRMTRAISQIIWGAILYQVIENNSTDHPEQVIAAYALGSYLFDSLPLSRRQEYESDRIGTIYMAKAGYNPHYSIELWEKMSRYHEKYGNKKPDFLRTHPNDKARIKALQAFMPVAMAHYKKFRVQE